ncbi:MAG: hypothetical protein FJ313_01930 [Gemmatimonadetes bacterium]|nr:hypothetical protein [Gemmatimonadota bacterium]
MKKATVGNLFGGHDEVQVRRDGSCRVRSSHAEGPKQLTIFGGVEFAHTKRNPWTDEREAEDTRKGLVAK